MAIAQAKHSFNIPSLNANKVKTRLLLFLFLFLFFILPLLSKYNKTLYTQSTYNILQCSFQLPAQIDIEAQLTFSCHVQIGSTGPYIV